MFRKKRYSFRGKQTEAKITLILAQACKFTKVLINQYLEYNWLSGILIMTLTKCPVFRHCPPLNDHAQEVDKILGNWKSYKMSVPTFGAIMLDPEMKYVSITHCSLEYK